jgi:hypothetical protein
MKREDLISLLLRLSIASVFAYAAVAAFIEPYNWIGYFPKFLFTFFQPTLLLHGFSFFQLLLALWIMSGWKTFLATCLAAITLLAIIIANLSQTDILFRDFAIFFAACALAVTSLKKKK